MNQKQMGKKNALVAGILAGMVLLSGCTGESASSGAGSVGAVDQPPEQVQQSVLPVLEVQAGGQTMTLRVGEESSCTVTLPEALPHPAKTEGTVQVFQADQAVFSGPISQLAEFLPGENGQYQYQFTVGGETFSLQVETAFAPQIFYREGAVTVGEVLPLAIRYTDAQTISVQTSLSFVPEFYQEDGVWHALLPIHWNTQPGSYPLTIQAGSSVFSLEIKVNDREFEIQNLTVSEETTEQTVENDDANAQWNSLIEPLKAVSDPQQYWSGPFLQPVEGEITTQYGMIRYVNDSPTSERHSGVDLAADAGTPVQAAGAGRVLFADYLLLTGNTVVIEHGYGLKSWYYHMESLDVAQGEMVERGQVIGKVGSTGFSTGPHLHFAMSVNRVFINPWTAIETGVSWEGQENEGDDF